MKLSGVREEAKGMQGVPECNIKRFKRKAIVKNLHGFS
jgi:hypothetical protein